MFDHIVVSGLDEFFLQDEIAGHGRSWKIADLKYLQEREFVSSIPFGYPDEMAELPETKSFRKAYVEQERLISKLGSSKSPKEGQVKRMLAAVWRMKRLMTHVH